MLSSPLLQNLFLFFWQRTHCCRIYSHYWAPVWISALQNTWFVFAACISYRDTHHAIVLVKYCKTAISVTDGHWFGGWFTSSEIFLGNGVHNDSTTFLKEKKKSEKEKKSFVIFSWLNQLLFLYACVCVSVCVSECFTVNYFMSKYPEVWSVGWEKTQLSVNKGNVALKNVILYIEPLYTQKKKTH